jgi:hypothetical protein
MFYGQPFRGEFHSRATITTTGSQRDKAGSTRRNPTGKKSFLNDDESVVTDQPKHC